jgi:hypothetical protein
MTVEAAVDGDLAIAAGLEPVPLSEIVSRWRQPPDSDSIDS